LERLYPETKAKIGKELIAKRWDTSDNLTLVKESFVNDTVNGKYQERETRPITESLSF